jgi:hypothetical protein
MNMELMKAADFHHNVATYIIPNDLKVSDLGNPISLPKVSISIPSTQFFILGEIHTS